jgi:hypothetical protein
VYSAVNNFFTGRRKIMIETFLGLIAGGGFYLLLGVGVLDICAQLARRTDDNPPDPLLTLLLWPVTLIVCALARFDGWKDHE